jgi:hypothetical protein
MGDVSPFPQYAFMAWCSVRGSNNYFKELAIFKRTSRTEILASVSLVPVVD